MKRNFVHLHNHSHYSLLDGLSKIEEMVETAKKEGMGALAITDHGNMYGAIDFYKTCKGAGIKPIIGVEAYLAARSRHDKEPGVDSKRYHLTLLSKNEAGYKNLIKLVTLSNLEGFYYKPRIDKEILRKFKDGLICLSGCPAGELSRSLAAKDIDKAREIVREYLDIFGKENYFLELMHHPDVENSREIREGIIELSREFDLPIVATQDSHYLHQEDKEAHETLLAINTNNLDEDKAKKFSFGEEDYSFSSLKKIEDGFKDLPEALENTKRVADLCSIDIELGKFIFPNFTISDGKSPDEKLRELVEKGLGERGLENDQKTKDRLEYELDIIKMKGYASYFLVVEDLIRFAHENGIFTNIRGSVAGSITTYLLGITKVNPIEYEIPFERFLNPERPSAPDIDMDFSDNRRDEMIEYAKRKYGEDKVAQIGTFGTMMARGSVRDVARALGYPYSVGDRISKMIPMGSQGFPMTIDRALELVPELKKAYKEEEDTKKILNLAKRIEGCVRHISVHAAGVVIAPRPLDEYVPLQFDPKGGKLITQYDMYSVGEDGIGLTKFDFLGIRNLSILSYAVKLVEKITGEKIDIENVPLDDRKTFEMLARGETEGLFQLNGSGITRFLKELKPTTIHDINAMVALYRPGPMQFIPDYIARKHNPRLIKYLDPALEKILNKTYGVLVYQDDLLIMAHDLAGYSWGEVDKFRKAVGKKIPEEMAKQKEKFIKGCVLHSKWSEKKATEIWSWIEPFAAYGFNKAHSASYGRVAYQTAYMKANFPVIYMCACLTAESGDIDTVAIYINECKRMGITVLPPNVNESFGEFGVIGEPGKETRDSKTIRFGLYSIKNLGTDIADAIIEERKARGKFKSMTEFLERIKHKNLNKKSLEALIKSGSMDEFGERGEFMANMEDMLEYNRNMGKEASSQASLFGALAPDQSPQLKLKKSEPASSEEKLAWEKELLGLYVSGHPLDKWKDQLAGKEINIKRLKEGFQEGMTTVILGIITEVKPIITKNNERMAFVKIADLEDNIEAVVFPKTYKEINQMLEKDKCLVFQGRISARNGEKSLIVEKVRQP
jgi:DNA polymerase-3 subunit alpha